MIVTNNDLWRRLNAIGVKIDYLIALQTKESQEMSKLDDEIAQLQKDVSGLTGVVQSAEALIGGIQGQIDAAVQAALAAGATQPQLQALTDLSAALEAQAAGLAQAVAAGTPPVPTGPTGPTGATGPTGP